MAKLIRILLGLTRMTRGEIIALAGAVCQKMLGNLNFPNPPVKMAKLKEAIDDCIAANAAALDGGRKAIAERDQKMDRLCNMLRQLRSYVQHNCNNDPAIATTSGFQLAPDAPPPPPSLSNVIRRIVDGQRSGEMLITLVRNPDAGSYQLRWRPERLDGLPEDWTMRPVVVIQQPTLVANLTPGIIYEFQVRALVDQSYTDWSDSIKRMAR